MKDALVTLVFAFAAIFSGIAIAILFVDASNYLWIWSFVGAFFMYLLGVACLQAWYDDGCVLDLSECCNEEENEENKKSIVVITETKCKSCGAPMEDDTCAYCGTKAVIYKTIN